MPKSSFKSRDTSHFNPAINPNAEPHASPVCIDKCKVLNGSDAVTVSEELDDRGVTTGWVAIFGSDNVASKLLISLSPPNSNEDYLEAVEHCAETNACQGVCPLTPYTYEEYARRGDISL